MALFLRLGKEGNTMWMCSRARVRVHHQSLRRNLSTQIADKKRRVSSTAKEEKMKGMVAIVTGSSSGIGAGIAVDYCRHGAQVTINGRNEENLKVVAQKCEESSGQKHKPLLVIGDITNEKSRKKLIEDTVKQFGRLDVLVNNAGFFTAVPVEINAGLDPLDKMLDVFVRAPYHLSKLALPHLIESKGVIINISSIAGVRPCSKVGLEYSVAKAAMDQATRWFASGLGSKGIRVNSINPGAITTDLLINSAGVSKEESDAIRAKMVPFYAMQRTGRIDEVAKVAVFLASKDSSFVTGINLPVDGGYLVMPQDFEVIPTK